MRNAFFMENSTNRKNCFYKDVFCAGCFFLKAKIKLNILGAVLFAFKIGYLANIYFGMQLKEIIFLGIYFLQQAMAVAIQEILCADRTATADWLMRAGLHKTLYASLQSSLQLEKTRASS